MKIRLADLHNNAITNLSPKRFSKYVAAAEMAGVETMLVSVWTTEMQNPLEQIQAARQIIDSTSTNVKLLLHIEDAWFINKQNIGDVLKLRPFSVGLTWNAQNALAGGAHSGGAVTPTGRVIIKKLAANGVYIDLAHLNQKSFFQVAELLGGQKLLCTHTCFDEIWPHPRNLRRRQIQTIVESGGLVGLTLVNDFLGDYDVLTHIKYFLENFGEDNLCIGTDFFGTKNLPKDLRKYKGFARFKKLLLAEGLSEEAVGKIFVRNVEKFLRY